MRLLRHLLILVTFVVPLFLNANNDTIRKRFKDKSFFVGKKWGADSLNVYKGKYYLVDFTQSSGFFKIQGEKISPLYVRKIDGASDTSFLNSIMENITGALKFERY